MDTTFKIDFIGIGASKSGTTWLGHMLEDHPALCMSVPKEVHFFNEILTYRNKLMERNYAKGLRWFKRHFDHCKPGKLKGEITPRYCHDPAAPKRIFDHNRDIRIFYCLRNPVDRIESHYNFAKYYLGKEDRPFEDAVKSEPEFIEMSMYYRNLSRYLALFPREQIKLIWFEDIRSQPETLLESVYAFLNVDTSFRPSRMLEKSNPGRVSKSPKLMNYINAFNQKLIGYGYIGLVRRIKKMGIGKIVQRLNSKPLQKDKMPPELKTWIIDQLRDDILHLQEWSGRDLSQWLK